MLTQYKPLSLGDKPFAQSDHQRMHIPWSIHSLHMLMPLLQLPTQWSLKLLLPCAKVMWLKVIY